MGQPVGVLVVGYLIRAHSGGLGNPQTGSRTWLSEKRNLPEALEFKLEEKNRAPRGLWADGQRVELIEEGSGRCAGWLRVRGGGISSWVREQYLIDAAQAPGR